MAQFTDIFIKRPVLATVVSLLILAFGIRAIYAIKLRQFPEIENTVITIRTAYPGADAQLIQGFITTPIQKAVAGADGIDYLRSESVQGISTIKAFIKLNFNSNVAFTNIMSKIAEVRSELPRESEDPVVEKSTGSQVALMYISFSSKTLSPGQITDYISRIVQPKLETIPGVAQVQILGSNAFAMRVWLDPQKMKALNVSSDQVREALLANNFQTSAGKTKGEWVALDIKADTDLQDVEGFKQLVVKSQDNALIRLKDIAKVELGAENYDSDVVFNGERATFIAITATPTANPLTVIAQVRQVLPNLQRNYPPALKSKIVYDGTKYVRSSVREVIQTILEATLIVIAVIFLFLGSIRSVLIPIVTIPLSLIGVCSFMLALGYSLNLLTLLAMVLAIGLVVDDAIVVVENIHRHIEEGKTPFKAAIQGAREIAVPVITITITLAAVYAPIGFMTGLTGDLFREFAFTLASSVILSGIIALTLSPMMCSKLLKPFESEEGFAKKIDHIFGALKVRYEKGLHALLDHRAMILVFTAVILISCFVLYSRTSKELAPTEDRSILFMSSTAPQYANIDYVTRFTNQFNSIFRSIPQGQDYFIINGMGAVNNVIAGLILKPWDQRKKTQAQLQPALQGKVSQVAGMNTFVFPLPSLPTNSDGPPVQFVITSTSGYPLIYEVAERMKHAALKSGLFLFIDNNLRYNKPQLVVEIDRSKAALLGINMADIGRALADSYSEGYLNRFDMQGRSYKVIPQVSRTFRLNPNELSKVHVRTAEGSLVPLSTVVKLHERVQPNKLAQFQQLNSATLEGLMRPGQTMDQGLNFLRQEARKILPRGMSYDYGGEARQFIQESNALLYAFFFAIIVIFLVLAAQFESFRDPFIVLISVPMSICGALIFLYLGLATINIYTQIGLVTLIGLISKHGILMVEFANKLQDQGHTVRESIEQAAAIRLRPVLMTTGATIMGVSPLLFASGAGGVSRFNLGLVISSGMAIGTLFTLFVVPTIYMYVAKKRKPNKGLLHAEFIQH